MAAAAAAASAAASPNFTEIKREKDFLAPKVFVQLFSKGPVQRTTIFFAFYGI